MLDRSISRRYRWKVQGRLAVLEYAASHGIRPAAARFGLDRKTVRAWRARFREVGTVGLVPRYLGIRHRYIRPRCPEENGEVERSHRIDEEEFWSRYGFESFECAAGQLAGWERIYNEQRFSMALNGRTPAEKLAAVLTAA